MDTPMTPSRATIMIGLAAGAPGLCGRGRGDWLLESHDENPGVLIFLVHTTTSVELVLQVQIAVFARRDRGNLKPLTGSQLMSP